MPGPIATLLATIMFLGLGAGRGGAAASSALDTLATEIAATSAEIEDAGTRAALPSRVVLDRDLAQIRGWRLRLDSLVPAAGRARTSAQAHDALVLRAQFVHMTRLITSYKAAAPARDDTARLGRAGYEALLRDELLLPYTASDIERIARAQLGESIAKIAWLETIAPLAHTVIAQERSGGRQVDVLAFLGTHAIVSVPAAFVAPPEADPSFVLGAIARANALHQNDLVRRSAASAVFEQGWLAYSAQMLVEVGLYGDDPTNRMRLALAQRADAADALVDLKVASGEWTFGQSVQFLVRETGANAQQAEAAAARIALRPGVAIAPLVGRLQIENLLAEYRRRMSVRGSLRDFHDRLLGYGSIPFAMLGPELLSDLTTS